MSWWCDLAPGKQTCCWPRINRLDRWVFFFFHTRVHAPNPRNSHMACNCVHVIPQLVFVKVLRSSFIQSFFSILLYQFFFYNINQDNITLTPSSTFQKKLCQTKNTSWEHKDFIVTSCTQSRLLKKKGIYVYELERRASHSMNIIYVYLRTEK